MEHVPSGFVVGFVWLSIECKRALRGGFHAKHKRVMLSVESFTMHYPRSHHASSMLIQCWISSMCGTKQKIASWHHCCPDNLNKRQGECAHEKKVHICTCMAQDMNTLPSVGAASAAFEGLEMTLDSRAIDAGARRRWTASRRVGTGSHVALSSIFLPRTMHLWDLKDSNDEGEKPNAVWSASKSRPSAMSLFAIFPRFYQNQDTSFPEAAFV
jgi:hypothetical protein